MDAQGAAAGPWIALGVAAAALLAVLATGAVLVLRARRPAEPEDLAARRSGDGAPAGVGFADDDLPGFGERPPGHPEARGATAHSTAPVPLAVRPSPPPSPAAAAAAARGPARLSPTAATLLIMAAAALLLVLAAAGIGLATRA